MAGLLDDGKSMAETRLQDRQCRAASKRSRRDNSFPAKSREEGSTNGGTNGESTGEQASQADDGEKDSQPAPGHSTARAGDVGQDRGNGGSKTDAQTRREEKNVLRQ
jgi:hypothetical protein